MKKNALSAISFVALLTILAKALGMLRDILQARAFGASAEMDAYTSASNFTVYIFSALAYALCIAAVAVLGRKLLLGRKQTEECANGLISLCLIISVILTATLVLLGITGVFGAEMSWYICILSMSMPVIVLTYMFMAFFQSLGHYSIQGSLSLLYNIVLCFVLFAFGRNMSVLVFAVCMSAAWLLQLATIVPYFFKEHYRFRLSFTISKNEIKDFAKTAFATLFTTSAFLLCYLTDSAQSAFMGEGVVSAFYYADKLFTPLATTVIYSISAVMFPKWSQKSKELDPFAYRLYVGKAVGNTVMFMLPLSALAAVFGVPMVRVLFEGGSFSADASFMTGRVFACYALGMVGFALLDLVAKAYYALGRTTAPLLVNVSVVVANILLNKLLICAGMSVYAVAAVTALVMSVGGAVLAAVFCKGTKGVFCGLRIAKSVVLSAVMFGVLHISHDLFINASDAKIMLVLKCAVIGIVSAAVYGLIMYRDIKSSIKEG